MKLRSILKLIAFLLLIFSTMVVLNHPLHYFQGNGTIASICGSEAIKMIELFLYLLFAFHMHMLDFKFPKAEFGKYFRYDMAVSCLNYYIINMWVIDNVMVGYLAKILVEIAAIATTFFCGWSLCKTLKNHGMKEIGLSYLVLSFRHVIYSIIIIVQFCILMFGPTKDVSQFFSSSWTVAQWLLLMPILFISRAMLFGGTMKLKVHKHRNNEI